VVSMRMTRRSRSMPRAADPVRTAGAGVIRQDGVDAVALTVKRGGQRGSPASSCSLGLHLPALACSASSGRPCKNLGEIVAGTIGNGNEVTGFRHARSHHDSRVRSTISGTSCSGRGGHATRGTRRPRRRRDQRPTTRNRDPKDAPDAESIWTDNVPIVDCPLRPRP